MKTKEEILKEATKRTLNINEGSPLHDAVMKAMEEYAQEQVKLFCQPAARGSRLVLDLSDEEKYFVKLENGNIVFEADKFGEAGKFECLYWIYRNGDCYYR